MPFQVEPKQLKALYSQIMNVKQSSSDIQEIKIMLKKGVIQKKLQVP